MIFKTGDRIKAFGCLGIINNIVTEENCKRNNCDRPIQVIFDDGHIADFTPDGKYLPWHNDVSLILVEHRKQ